MSSRKLINSSFVSHEAILIQLFIFRCGVFFFFLLILYMSNPTEVVVLFSSLFSLIISHTPTSWLQVSLQTTLRISTLAPLIHLLAEQASQLVKKQVLRLLKVVSILMSHQHLSSCSPTKELTSQILPLISHYILMLNSVHKKLKYLPTIYQKLIKALGIEW